MLMNLRLFDSRFQDLPPLLRIYCLFARAARLCPQIPIHEKQNQLHPVSLIMNYRGFATYCREKLYILQKEQNEEQNILTLQSSSVIFKIKASK